MKEQIIGTYGGKISGPLVIVLGGLHGNEPAGVKAIVEIFRLLHQEPSVNPGFVFKGTLVGLVGHLHAYREGRRYIVSDLNRHWTTANLERIRSTPVLQLKAEDLEMAQLLYSIQMTIRQHRPDSLILLDLHTTSAEGGIFCIPMNECESLDLAKELYAPVVLGLHEGIEGTLLQAAANHVFHIGDWPRQIVGVAFEAGQHTDPLSASRAVAAIVHALRAAGCIRPDDVESRH
ncbi:MAG TPA: succinylglutamate desuccinylase/aspartoacylase family protein, partial [Saprospiraceae bacterium]|nr:succinylglutamate desuccinylase/aspartoacylase family protein [Saprospiraceae bacterium]